MNLVAAGAAVLGAAASVLVVYVDALGRPAIGMALFAFGAATVIPAVFRLTRAATAGEWAKPHRSVVLSVINAGMIAGGAVLQPAVGAVLDAVDGPGADGDDVERSSEAYKAALGLLPAAYGTALFLSLVLAWLGWEDVKVKEGGGRGSVNPVKSGGGEEGEEEEEGGREGRGEFGKEFGGRGEGWKGVSGGDAGDQLQQADARLEASSGLSGDR